MDPAAAETRLIEDFSLIPDPHERLAAIVAACTGPGLPESSRHDHDLVPGCVSRVWITAAVENGVLQLRWDADSPLVRGLAGLICHIYNGTAPAAAAAHETGILAGLQLTRQLSPTRLNGLTNVAQRIRTLAAASHSAA
jgi:cysteine desulfuration protein SufE